jgi:hypothetical protein
MCGGQKKAHHAREEAKRAAAQEEARMRQSIEAAEKRNRELAEALKPVPAAYTPPPVSSNAMLGSQGVRAPKARKTGTLAARRGASSLRIPLNVGQRMSGGTNIG